MEDFETANDKTPPFHIFKDENYTKDGFEHELALFGLACFELAIAVEAAEGNNRPLRDAAFHIADNIGYPGKSWAYNTVRNSAMIDIAVSEDRHDTEAKYYGLFEKHISKVLGDNAKIIEGHSNAQNKPDKWVEMNGVEIPVEMKKGDFDDKAMKQLRRYMDVFNSIAGIAVGRRMTVDCPENVIFVRTSSLDYWESLETKIISLEEILAE